MRQTEFGMDKAARVDIEGDFRKLVSSLARIGLVIKTSQQQAALRECRLLVEIIRHKVLQEGEEAVPE
jgi:hypothetical protein